MYLTKSGISRRKLIGSGLVLTAASAFPRPALAQSPVEVHVGTANTSSDIGFFLADKKGWFKE
jgi:hypothetical protein